MSAAADLAAEVTADLMRQGAAMGFAVDEAEVPPAPVAQQGATEVAAVQETVEDAVPIIDLNPELPEDLAELLAFDDDDEPVVPEINTEASEDDEWTSPQEVARLKAELEKARKKAEFAEKQRLETAKPKWMAEASKYFPLSNPGTIEAQTRREFLRQAEAQHKSLLPHVERIKSQQDAWLEQERQRVRDEVRKEVEAAWGKPLSGPGVVPVEASEREAALKKARASGNLEKVVGVLLGHGN